MAARGDGPEEQGQQEFPLHCLPLPLASMAREIATAALVPVPLAACAVIGVASASLGAGLELPTRGGRNVRGNVYILGIAESGSGKSVALECAIEPVKVKLADEIEHWRSNVKPDFDAERAVAEKRLERLKNQAAQAKDEHERGQLIEDVKTASRELAELESRNVEPKLFIGDATREALAAEMAKQPGEALASISGEARGIVGVICGRYSSKGGGDEDIYLQGFSGDAVAIDRKKGGSVHLRRPCLSVLWFVQPDVWQKMHGTADLSDSGLLARFLLCDTHAQPEDIPEEDVEISLPVALAYSNRIQELLTEYRQNGADPRAVHRGDDVWRFFRVYENGIRKRRREGDLSDVGKWAARWTENAWRLALLFHAVTHGRRAHLEPLKLETAEMAAGVVDWFAQEQLALLSVSRKEGKAKRLARLTEALKNHGGKAQASVLHSSNGIDRAEVEKLAAEYPDRISLETIAQTTGRPGLWVTLK